MGKLNGNSDGEISPMELESLAANGDYDVNNKRAGLDRLAAAASGGGIPNNPIDKLMMLLKLYFELYPKLMLSGSTLLVGLLLYSWSPWQGWGAARNSTRNYMTHDYTNMRDNFNFQSAQIDHWCLFGGDDRCYCEDPTEAMSRSEVPGWGKAHIRNKQLVKEAASRGVDVVFFGDQNIQSWDGRWLDRPAPEGSRISKLFNKTFVGGEADFQAVALGIYGDRINNLLWRIQHGELSPSLNPKIFWLVMGTNDLALGMCSEEVVTLGIMRIAEEVHHLFPDAIVVIQGILPRSNHRDGSLEGKTKKKSSRPKTMFRDRTASGGGAGDIEQYVPMVPGGRRKLVSKEGTYNEMDEILMEELEEHIIKDEQQNNRELQDLTTPGTTTTSTETTTTTSAEAEDEPATTSTETTTSTAAEPATTSSSSSSSTALPTAHTRVVDGSKITFDSKGNMIGREEKKAPQPYYDYYLWPSIQAINKELAGFCEKHQHFIYFDADDLILGSIGNAHYRAAHKTIITELMPNYVHLSYLGHQVVMGALNEELKRIIYDDDETNDIETKEGRGGKRGGKRQ